MIQPPQDFGANKRVLSREKRELYDNLNTITTWSEHQSMVHADMKYHVGNKLIGSAIFMNQLQTEPLVVPVYDPRRNLPDEYPELDVILFTQGLKEVGAHFEKRYNTSLSEHKLNFPVKTPIQNYIGDRMTLGLHSAQEDLDALSELVREQYQINV